MTGPHGAGTTMGPAFRWARTGSGLEVAKWTP